MNTEQMEEQYTRIAHAMISMIPEEWDWIKLYNEYWDGYHTAFFYYAPSSGGEPVYSLDIPDIFDVSEEQFDQSDEELYDVLKALWVEFGRQEQQPWTSLTFSLARDGKMNIDYGYEDLSELDPVEKQNRWEAEHIAK
ncbi:immunity protein YezG family protein [Edaphobacillus lindanitolerans]|uniref:DUF600 family protein n=1 Tax=Edaphobacillus lindanitolerans TaxID=550447 RepID=A0A1U7PN52_9BACI|nr:immunity protein YezG family protein [Edaphobacillus lindanitolerans]SIT87184.1 conserved hypothetical protein [Edaphobacillus lindanitolerans]